MLNLKRLLRFTLCLLLACALLLPMGAPARAEEGSQPEVAETDLVRGNGHTVSLVHYSASAGSLAIGCLEDGTKLTVLGTYGSFFRIDCYEMVGYIAQSQTVKGENGEYYVNCKAGSAETKTLPSWTAQSALDLKERIRSYAMDYLGVPYVSGGSSRWGFDCCGYSRFVFRGCGVPLSHHQSTQIQDGVVISKADLQCGDLLFFKNTTNAGLVTHVGIYIGNNQMIHAGNSGISIVDLDDPYYQYHFLCARRVILSDLPTQAVMPPMGLTQNMNSSYWRESSQTDDVSGDFF